MRIGLGVLEDWFFDGFFLVVFVFLDLVLGGVSFGVGEGIGLRFYFFLSKRFRV